MNFNVPEVPIALFDLDDTLINKDSNSLWVIWRAGKSLKGKIELMSGLLIGYLAYKRGKLTARKMNTFYWIRTLFMNPDSYTEMANTFFKEKGIHHIYEDAVNLVEAHRKKGIHLVMITGQDEYVSYPFYSYFKMDGLISNRRIVKDSQFIGFEEPNCYGEGKVVLAQEYARKIGVELKDCAFYSDSISDLPLLNEVRYPVAVNPHPELRHRATVSDWPIIEFAR